MATQDDLIISIQADSAKAVAGLENIQKELKTLNSALAKTTAATDKVQKATTDWGASFLKLNAAIGVAQTAYRSFAGVIGSTVGAFIESDDAANKLKNTLKLVGEKDVETATKGFEQFAKQLQKNSVVGDDTAVEMLAMAKALRLSDDQAKALVQTSADLAAVTGKDVKGAFEGLLATYKGQAGEVSKLAPELKNLTEAQLKQGDAVKVLGDKFAGFAKAQTQTIGGQLKQVENLYGDALESIGGLFSEFFRMDDQSLAIAALETVIETIETIKPTIIELRQNMEEFASKVVAGFTAVSDKASVIQAALVPIGVAIAVAFGPAAIAAVAAMASAFIAAAIPAALLAAKVLLITVAVTGVVAAIEFLVRNFSDLASFAGKVAEAIAKAFIGVGKTISQIFSVENMKKIFSGGAVGFDALAESAKKSFSDAIGDIGSEWRKTSENLDFGVAGQAITGIKQFMEGFNKEVVVATKNQQELTKSTQGTKVAMSELSKEGQAAYDSLLKKVEELRGKQAEASQNVIAQIDQRAVAEMKALDLMQKQLAASGALNAKAREQLTIARQLVEANKGAEIANAQKKSLDEILQKNKELQVQVDSMGSTQQENIQRQLQLQLDVIEKKREELKIQGLLNEKTAAALDAQAGLAKAGAAKQSSAAPAQIQESLTMAGADLGKGITDAFAPMMGAIGGVNAYVAAAQAVVDAIPQMLDNITKLLDSITELPLKILNSFGKLLDAVLRLITELPKNLIKMITGIILKATEFLKELPKVIINLLKELPGMLMGLLDQLPDMISDFIQALIEAGPQISMAIMEFMIKDSPKIAMKLLEYLAIRLPLAIIKGIVNGLKNVAKMIQGFFTGKGFNLVDTKAVEKNLKDVIKKVSGSASRLFSVMDLSEQAKAAEKAKDLTRQVTKAGEDAISALKKAWQWVMDHIIQPLIDLLLKAWRWVWDNVLEPILNLVKKAWMWVVENILEPLADIVYKAWIWVKEKILEPLGGIVSDAWKWVVEKVLEPLGGIVSSAWQWVVDKVLSPLGGIVSSAWKWVVDNVLDPLGGIVSSAWKWVKDKILDPLGGVVSSAWQWVKDNILDKLGSIVSSAWTWVKDNIIDKLAGAVSAAWTWVKENILDKIASIVSSAWTWVKDNIIDKLAGVVSTAWTWVKDNILDKISGAVSAAWTWVKDNILDKLAGAVSSSWEWVKKNVIDKMTSLGTTIWDGLKAGLDGAASMFTGFGTKIWDSLKSGLDTVGDIFKKIFDKLDPSDLFAKLFKTPGASQGFIEGKLGFDVPIVSFAKGGMAPRGEKLPGKPLVQGDSELNDNILALLSPGEMILTRTQVMELEKVLGKLPKFAWYNEKPKFVQTIQTAAADLDNATGGNFQAAAETVQTVAQKIVGGDLTGALKELDPTNNEQVKAALDSISDVAAVFGELFEKFKDRILDESVKGVKGVMLQGFQSGGMVGDSVPAMLTPGEFVMSRAGVAAAGLGNLQAMNAGRSGQASVINYNIDMPVTIENKGMPIDANFVRQRILPTIEQELKRASLEGRFVISERGIRNA